MKYFFNSMNRMKKKGNRYNAQSRKEIDVILERTKTNSTVWKGRKELAKTQLESLK